MKLDYGVIELALRICIDKDSSKPTNPDFIKQVQEQIDIINMKRSREGVAHKLKDLKQNLLKKDGTWNILCDKQGNSSCKATNNWTNVTCKRCLKLKSKEKKDK